MASKTPETGLAEVIPGTVVDGNHFFMRGASAATRALERIVANIAPTDIPVLLVGESGTGKEVLALQIHRLSRRRNEPFIKMSCAALTPEFFNGWNQGSEGGEVTNIGSRRGTVFLDEISELDPACQPKLLYALPDGDAVPQERCLGARVICATGRNLKAEILAGRFREELYFRINGVCLRLPPLRERKEEIPAFVDFFLTKYAGLFERGRPSLSAQTLNLLLEYPWPGNIRELENVVKKIVALGDERVAVADLGSSLIEPRPLARAAEALSLKQASRAASRQAERELILKVLARTRWNRKRAAQELQISYKALLYKLKQLELENSAGS